MDSRARQNPNATTMYQTSIVQSLYYLSCHGSSNKCLGELNYGF